ncbi:MAG: ImmA/IrrE family metallo-endopeptidase, partial [Flavobacterium sp.]
KSNKKAQPELLLDEAASYVSHVFNWQLDDIWSKKELLIKSNAAAEAFFKMPANANSNQIKAYAHYGYYLAKIMIKAINYEAVLEYPSDTTSFKKELIARYEQITLESLIKYAWDLGIIVLPLNDSGLFHGASWNIQGQHVIIVKQNTNSHSRWIFDLLHEIYHVLDHLQEDNSSIIEVNELSPFSDQDALEEREANSFANQILFDGKAEEYAQESVRIANWNLNSLKKAAEKVAHDNKLRVDSLANYLAFRLSYQNQNWWAQANKLQITDPNPFSIAVNILKDHISFNQLSPIEQGLLKMAINI